MIDLELASKFVGMYNRNKSMLDFFIESEVPKRVLLRTYELLVKENLTKIEDLPESEKTDLVRECRATGIRFTNETLRQAARILHTLKFINNETTVSLSNNQV
jgi:hypothetical protein